MARYLGKRAYIREIERIVERYGAEEVWTWMADHFDSIGYRHLRKDKNLSNEEYVRLAVKKEYFSEAQIRNARTRVERNYLRGSNSDRDNDIEYLCEAMEEQKRSIFRLKKVLEKDDIEFEWVCNPGDETFYEIHIPHQPKNDEESVISIEQGMDPNRDDLLELYGLEGPDSIVILNAEDAFGRIEKKLRSKSNVDT